MVAAQQTGRDQPWRQPDAVIIIDPYAPNAYRAATVAGDPKVKAIIHQASQGLTPDRAFLARANEARAAHLRWGAYHLGLVGDPLRQADLFLDLAKRSGATFLALDIEAIGGRNMPLADAARFIKRVHDVTGRYPALYVNASVARTIGTTYDGGSIFARTPLWLARFVKTMPPFTGNKVWHDYTLWQFGSELNCPGAVRAKHKDALCEPYRPDVVPGVRYDMDVNVVNGGAATLDALFGGEGAVQ